MARCAWGSSNGTRASSRFGACCFSSNREFGRRQKIKKLPIRPAARGVRKLSGAAIAKLQRGRRFIAAMSTNWQQSSKSLAVIGPAKKAAQAQSTPLYKPGDILLQGTFSASGEEDLSIAIFAPEAEQSAQQMAKQTGGKVYRGNMSGEFTQQSGSSSGRQSPQSGHNPTQA